MKAIILVGGQGTRLRPLTNSTPKPLLPLLNRPFLDHVLFLLKTHGITDIVLAVGYRSESFEPAYGDGSHLGVKLTYVKEDKPLDTGWAIKNVEQHLNRGETFLVFNGDVLTDLDLTDMIKFHRENSSVCTISLTPVEDVSSYGVVEVDEGGRVQRFLEKPKPGTTDSRWINAGTYVMETDVLDYISEPRFLDEIPAGRPYSVEYGLFPQLLQEGRPVYGYRTGAYWLDMGTPERYLQAQNDLLIGRLKSSLEPEGEQVQDGVWAGEGTFIDKGARVTGPVVLGKGCKLRANSVVTGPASLGDGCHVGEEAQVQNVIAFSNVTFGAVSKASDSLFGHNATIGAECDISGMTIVGDNATIGATNRLSGDRVEIGAEVPAPRHE
ncbi:MAG: mannose-phosphate guanylyltransferase [Chloroflexia bacterium]|jgi:mannose-1-phosphate guanylyltransferase|nr:mannose-phosphate guanylyltransferase [Chloroflexia bacterium]